MTKRIKLTMRETMKYIHEVNIATIDFDREYPGKSISKIGKIYNGERLLQRMVKEVW